MRISDWSSDVCSSDLAVVFGTAAVSGQRGRGAAARRSRADCIGTAGGLMSDQQHTACGTMVAKPVTIGVVGVIVLASALVLNHFILPGEEGEKIGRHTTELQSLMRISYAVFCLKKKN